MDIQIHSLGFDADKKLIDFINSKTKKLSLISEEIIIVEVILRVENSQDAANKTAEIKLDIPKDNIFAKKHAKTFEEAVDNVVDAIKTQLKKRKEKTRGK